MAYLLLLEKMAKSIGLLVLCVLGKNSMYIAIDPGDTTGWATFNEQGELIDFQEIKGHDNFLDWLEQQNARVYIVESYRVRTSGHINSFSTVPTLQLIGAIKRVAKKKGIKIVMQEVSPALSIGLRFIGMHSIYKGKHVPDRISALAHGTYYLRQ